MCKYDLIYADKVIMKMRRVGCSVGLRGRGRETISSRQTPSIYAILSYLAE